MVDPTSDNAAQSGGVVAYSQAVADIDGAGRKTSRAPPEVRSYIQ